MSHLFGVVEGVQYKKSETIRPVMYQVCKKLGLTVVNEAFHQFDPHGTTGVLVLSESHFSVHTYPENSRIYLDLFCCSKDFKPAEAAKVIKDHFGGTFCWSHVERFNLIDTA